MAKSDFGSMAMKFLAAVTLLPRKDSFALSPKGLRLNSKISKFAFYLKYLRFLLVLSKIAWTRSKAWNEGWTMQ